MNKLLIYFMSAIRIPFMKDKPPKKSNAGRPKVRTVERMPLSLKVEPALHHRFTSFAKREAWSFPVALEKLLSNWEDSQPKQTETATP
jgi:hypothetical protein